jgi:hypothetical protein
MMNRRHSRPETRPTKPHQLTTVTSGERGMDTIGIAPAGRAVPSLLVDMTDGVEQIL